MTEKTLPMPSPVATHPSQQEPTTAGRRTLLMAGGALGLGLLSGCGFRVRGGGLNFGFDRILVLGPDQSNAEPGAQTGRPAASASGSVTAPATPANQRQFAQPVTGNGLVERLRRELSSRYKRTLAGGFEDAEVVIRITSIQSERLVVGYSGSGRPREIELRRALSFRAEDAAGRSLIPPDTLELRRTVSISESDVLASDDAERFQTTAMENDLLQQLLRRIAAIRRDAAPIRSNPA